MNALALIKVIRAAKFGGIVQRLKVAPKVTLRIFASLFFGLAIWVFNLTLQLEKEIEAHDKTTKIATQLIEQIQSIKSGLDYCVANGKIIINYPSEMWAIVQCKRLSTNIWGKSKK